MLAGEIARIRCFLDELYDKYNHREFIGSDPIGFVYEYDNRFDMETVGFVASALAYGRVEQIARSLRELFGLMGKSPYEFIREFDARGRRRLEDFKHRFTSGEDISNLFELLRVVFWEHGSLENYFVSFYDKKATNVIPAMSGFCNGLLDRYSKKHVAKLSSGLKYLLSRPERGSVCKRLNLFLRWMVRDDEIDAGLWKSIDKNKLIVPMDVHMGRICRLLRFYEGKNISLKKALEVTKKFLAICPEDPVRYDFVLCRLGMLNDTKAIESLKKCVC